MEFEFQFTERLLELDNTYREASKCLIGAARTYILIPFCDRYGLKFEHGFFYDKSSKTPIDYDKDTGYPWSADGSIPALPLELLEVLNSSTLDNAQSIWITMESYTPDSYRT